MKRINLTKYGFVRYPEEDFHDDGNNFTCYRFSNTNSHVSKLVADGQAYLSVHVNGNLPYDVYSKLPNYRTATWSFNGVSVESLTDEMLQAFFNACVEYEKEYLAAEASIEYPTLAEIKAQAQKIYALRYSEINKISQLMATCGTEAAIKLSKWEWQNIRDYVTNLCQEHGRYNPDTFPQTIVGTAESFNFVKPDNNKLKPSYWFEAIVKMFEKVALD